MSKVECVKTVDKQDAEQHVLSCLVYDLYEAQKKLREAQWAVQDIEDKIAQYVRESTMPNEFLKPNMRLIKAELRRWHGIA